MGFVRVASLAELPVGEVIGVQAEGVPVCLARCDDGEVYAFADRCSHREFPLSNGELDPEECTITCEWHGAMFSVREGTALTLPATRPVPVYDCRVAGDDILVDVGG